MRALTTEFMLVQIGQGTYSNVYKARDLETGKIVALKKVRFDNLEPESVRFMAREIQVLRRLDHPNVVKLEGLVTSRMSCSLYLVFEYMEHDLAGLAACPGIMFTEAQVWTHSSYQSSCYAKAETSPDTWLLPLVDCTVWRKLSLMSERTCHWIFPTSNLLVFSSWDSEGSLPGVYS